MWPRVGTVLWKGTGKGVMWDVRFMYGQDILGIVLP